GWRAAWRRWKTVGSRTTPLGAVPGYWMPPTPLATRRCTPAWTRWSAGSSNRDARGRSLPLGAGRRAAGRRALAQDRPRPPALERDLGPRRAGGPDPPQLPELHPERAGSRRLRRLGRRSRGAPGDRCVRPPRRSPAPGADARAADARRHAGASARPSVAGLGCADRLRARRGPARRRGHAPDTCPPVRGAGYGRRRRRGAGGTPGGDERTPHGDAARDRYERSRGGGPDAGAEGRPRAGERDGRRDRATGHAVCRAGACGAARGALRG